MAAVNSGRLPINKLAESSPEEMMRKVMTRLWLRIPVDKIDFKQRFGKLPEDVFAPQLQRLKEKGLIQINDKEIKITKLGDIWKGNIAWEFAEPTATLH
jgi:coproporphyrinogen III oxidase-like Fe-S oxidoreductase